jgi:predicted RNA-binding Zn ribbon-like protein
VEGFLIVHGTQDRPPPIFVGDHIALDFLNTNAEQIEWLSNGVDLVNWLERVRAIGPDVAALFRADDNTFGALDAVAEQARSLREWWRDFVHRHRERPLSARALRELEPLNRLLARDQSYRLIEISKDRGGDGISGPRPLRRRQERRWTNPEQLLLAIAEPISDLVCEEDFRLVRLCEGRGCTLMFYDRTKTHNRRWCSMAVCGNRTKAAVRRDRLRQDEAKPK